MQANFFSNSRDSSMMPEAQEIAAQVGGLLKCDCNIEAEDEAAKVVVLSTHEKFFDGGDWRIIMDLFPLTALYIQPDGTLWLTFKVFKSREKNFKRTQVEEMRKRLK